MFWLPFLQTFTPTPRAFNFSIWSEIVDHKQEQGEILTIFQNPLVNLSSAK